MNELNILCLSGLAFTLYNIIIIYKLFGTPESISSTSYLLKSYNGKPWLFSFICIVVAVGLFPIWVNFSNDCYDFLTFISCAGIIFAGATPMFRESLEKPIHYGSGIILAISYILWFILNEYWEYLAAVGVISIIFTLIKPKNYVYYFEVVAYYTLVSLFIF